MFVIKIVKRRVWVYKWKRVHAIQFKKKPKRCTFVYLQNCIYNTIRLNKTLTNILSDFRFWIILFFLIRLIGIDNNILYPRLDISGDKTGISGMEFPLLNYLIYLLSEVFGYQHWYGRLINLIFSSLGLWYFFMLVKKHFSPKTAFNASLILMFSIWFTYSRKIMPDTFSMSLILASIYYGTNYFHSNSKSTLNLCLYFSLTTLGMLSKLPSAYLLALFVLLVFDKKIASDN